MRSRGTQGEEQDYPNGSFLRDAFRFTPSSWMNGLPSHWTQWESRRQRRSLVPWRPELRSCACDASASATTLAIYGFARRLGKEPHAAPSLPSPVAAHCAWSLRILRNRGMHGTTVPTRFAIEVAASPPLVEGPMLIDMDDRWGLYVGESFGPITACSSSGWKGRPVIRRLKDLDGDGNSDVDGMAGNCRDNVFIEPSWRSLKYETMHLAECEEEVAAERRRAWMDRSSRRPHSRLWAAVVLKGALSFRSGLGAGLPPVRPRACASAG